jgi:3D (Asp-Asp-Asp) domain-containing protein
MRKTTKVLALTSLALLTTNLIMGTSYVIDKQHLEEEIFYQTTEADYFKKKQVTDFNEYQKIMDGLSRIIEEKQTEIHSLEKQLENAMKDSESPSVSFNVQLTAYTANCKGCSGVTYSGFNVKNTIEYEGRRIIAANFSKIPLYSIVRIDTNSESFEAIVLDTGGAIRNSNVIDLLVSNYDTAIQFGRQNATVTILREGNI